MGPFLRRSGRQSHSCGTGGSIVAELGSEFTLITPAVWIERRIFKLAVNKPLLPLARLAQDVTRNAAHQARSTSAVFFTSLTFWWALLWFSLSVAIALGLLFEARCSDQLLSEVRHEILEGAIVYPHALPNAPPISGHQSSPS
jgi:hypothetical protein